MAPLEVIGAGLSRCGTDSLRVALNMLGYNTHHMRELLETDGHPEVFEEAYKNPEKPVDWDSVYEGFSAAVDCPSIFVLPRLFKKYPDAKVILTKRDFDSWYKSVSNTIFHLHDQLPENPQEFAVRTRRMVKTIWLNGSFQDMQKFKDEPELIKTRFEAHNAWVVENVPADRLLVLDLRDGINWDKLCAFLGKPIPDEPYPRINSTQSLNKEYQQMLKSMAVQGEDQQVNGGSSNLISPGSQPVASTTN
ncbi:P-loop containing nucleoside triphosphate hydrolase protein [Zychaea mexicana]|uniref:P-loop containing nucleoside triphosphate hydrolase protein n=1 Tax=Zychaea mexicana TaxID=64656 RepID=UPI0022FECD56|nr:P-loop containing nucleoside triphosphate hydrolase protein [Zychaea mexicana]KAI9491219.1 P-loop containing nucleoside triphosphate hydrolase protein [Zychaea mexicana]